jgi:hypothetical protein
MEAVTDTLTEQITRVLLSKIDEQKFDPDFLQTFAKSLLNKLNLKDIKGSKQTTTNPPQSQSNSLINDLKKVYKDLLKDNSYKTEYRKFLKEVLPKKLGGKEASSDGVFNKVTETDTTSKGIIDKPDEEKKIIFDGFSERGWRFFSERLPKILKDLPFFKPTPEKQKGSGMGLLGGGIALLLGGLAALVAGLMTDGPFKGILKILSKAGIGGGIKLLQIAAKVFIGGLKSVIMAPINLLKSAAKSIGKIFGKGAYKAILKPIRAISGLFTKMLGGLVKFATPLLKKIPLIGTIISWGFAYTRFKSGDVVGGIIDVLSGIASIFPGVGTAIAVGLDVLNAFLDFKKGGASEKANEKKEGWFSSMWKGFKNWIVNSATKWPILGPLVKSFQEFRRGNYLKGLKQLAYVVPLFETIGAMLGDKETTPAAQGMGNFLKKVGKWIAEKAREVPIIGPAIRASEEFSKGNYLKGFKQIAYIIPPLELLGALLGDKETGAVAQKGAGIIKSIGSFLKKLGIWMSEKIREVPIIGPAIRAVEEFSKGNYVKGFKQFAYIFPGFELLGALLGDKETGKVAQGGASIIKSIGSFFKNIRNSILKAILNLLPEKILGISIRSRAAKLLGVDLGSTTDDTQPVNQQTDNSKITENTQSPTPIKDGSATPVTSTPIIKDGSATPVTSTPISNENITSATVTPALMKDGGVIPPGYPNDTFPAMLSSGEKVIPAEKAFEPQSLPVNDISLKQNSPITENITNSQTLINDKILQQIAANTGSTKDSIKILGHALERLAFILEKKPSGNNTTVINTGTKGQSSMPASVVAGNNFDNISQIRRSFSLA